MGFFLFCSNEMQPKQSSDSAMESAISPGIFENTFSLICIFFTMFAVFTSYVLTLR